MKGYIAIPLPRRAIARQPFPYMTLVRTAHATHFVLRCSATDVRVVHTIPDAEMKERARRYAGVTR